MWERSDIAPLIPNLRFTWTCVVSFTTGHFKPHKRTTNIFNIYEAG